MPDYPPIGEVPRIEGGTLTVSLLAAGGDKTTVQVERNPDATTGQREDLRAAIGSMSNAAVFSHQDTVQWRVPLTAVNPFDESYSSAADKLIMQYQNADLHLMTVAIPAPDESYFASDGVTVSATNPTVVSFNAALLAYVNAGSPAGTWDFLRGYRTSRSRRQRPPRTVRASVEPGPGDTPPDAPGT
jgi:predicted dinucleotide-binding enzyme